MHYPWKDDYSVNIPRFDNHHKNLFDIANKLFALMKMGKGQEVIEETLIDLIDHTRYYLSEEEKAMERIGYSDIVAHKRVHRIFVDQLVEMMDEIKEGRALFVAIKFSKTIVDWLIDHIFRCDKKFAQEFNAFGLT